MGLPCTVIQNANACNHRQKPSHPYHSLFLPPHKHTQIARQGLIILTLLYLIDTTIVSTYGFIVATSRCWMENTAEIINNVDTVKKKEKTVVLIAGGLLAVQFPLA